MSTLVERIRENAAKFYAIRERVGAVKSRVYRITRVWREEIGVGIPMDKKETMEPAPIITNLEHRTVIRQAGETREGQLLLRGILRGRYTEDDLSNKPRAGNMERFWMIDERLYVTKTIEKKQVTWNVTIEKTNLKNLFLKEG